MESEGEGKKMAGSTSTEEEPRDARVVRELLRSMGIGDSDYEPRVVHQFLELCYRYVVDVLSDAQIYSEHAGKPSIDPEDVRLAIQSKVNFSFSQPPPREVLLELARKRNKIPLPKSIAPPGAIPLPPDQDTLLSPNYQILVPRKQPSHVEETEEEDNSNPNSNPTPSQEQRTNNDQQQPPQRISFPLASAAGAAAKRPR